MGNYDGAGSYGAYWTKVVKWVAVGSFALVTWHAYLVTHWG